VYRKLVAVQISVATLRSSAGARPLGSGGPGITLVGVSESVGVRVAVIVGGGVRF
jgi:hypothetical protein